MIYFLIEQNLNCLKWRKWSVNVATSENLDQLHITTKYALRDLLNMLEPEGH